MKDEDWGQEVGFSCMDCRFFDATYANDEIEVGICRRHPPVGSFKPDRPTEFRAGFPEVSSHEWCGEFELEPAKGAQWADSRSRREGSA